jgi:hypothetical protein
MELHQKFRDLKIDAAEDEADRRTAATEYAERIRRMITERPGSPSGAID